MERHETLGLVVLGVFAALVVWRLARRGVWRGRELPLALTAGAAGVVVLTYTAHLGGVLVFDHALGIPTARLGAVVTERGGEAHEHAPGVGHDLDTTDSSPPDRSAAARDSTARPVDESKPHTHTDSNAHTRGVKQD